MNTNETRSRTVCIGCAVRAHAVRVRQARGNVEVRTAISLRSEDQNTADARQQLWQVKPVAVMSCERVHSIP